MRSKLKIYKAKGGWRWKLLARNGRHLCGPGEAFSSYAKACKNIVLCRKAFRGAELVLPRERLTLPRKKARI